MTHRDRVAEALSHSEPDRCPWQASFTPEFARRLRTELHLGGAGAHNPHGGGNPYDLEVAFDQDVLITSVGWANSYYGQGDEYVDEWGVGWQSVAYTTPYGVGHYTEPRGHPLADAGALAYYQPPDPTRPELYADAQRLIAEHGDEYWIVGSAVTTIFETAWAMRGLEQLMIDFIEDPDLADAILDIPYQYHLAAAETLAGMGVDMIWLGDDVGQQQGMLISPRHWRRFLKPRLANIINRVKSVNPALKVAYHTDGCVYAIIPELIEIGLDVLNPVQPAAMDPARLKREYGRELCFWGSIDEQHTMPFGRPDEVRREVEERVKTVGQDGGLILAPTHHLQLDTPLENFWALLEAVGGARPGVTPAMLGGEGQGLVGGRPDGGPAAANRPRRSRTLL
ncbi:MAG: uroporphyrinogen decarboxylase family protein [Acidimicrobiales bacterium]|jgi:uroporphyrinogen decarboxylase